MRLDDLDGPGTLYAVREGSCGKMSCCELIAVRTVTTQARSWERPRSRRWAFMRLISGPYATGIQRKKPGDEVKVRGRDIQMLWSDHEAKAKARADYQAARACDKREGEAKRADLSVRVSALLGEDVVLAPAARHSEEHTALTVGHDLFERVLEHAEREAAAFDREVSI